MKVFTITCAKISIYDSTEGICSRIPETGVMLIEYFIKILRCFSYLMKFTFIASDKTNHIGRKIINICLTSRKKKFI